jgi:hypothetical protein
VTVAGAAGTAARSVARHAAEAVESFGDLVAEARTELDDADQQSAPPAKKTTGARNAKKTVTVTDITVE